jgi:hypothetical protein
MRDLRINLRALIELQIKDIKVIKGQVDPFINFVFSGDDVL